MTNKQIARTLRETAALIELIGGNAFRARAYQSASRTIDRLDEPVSELVQSNRLTAVDGIGSAMAAQLEDLLSRGTFDLLEELISSVPPGLIEILRIKGIGAKKARTLWKQRGITTVEELIDAAGAGMLTDLPGFGKKTQETVRKNAERYQSYRSHRRYAEAMTVSGPFMDVLVESAGAEQVAFGGDLRRNAETVDLAEFIVAAKDVDGACTRLEEMLSVRKEQETGDEAVLSGALPDGLALRIRIVAPAQFGTALWRSTGSDDFCSSFEARFGPIATAADEEAVFRSAGVPFIAPELRENRGEIEAAVSDDLPELLRTEDLHGVLHTHSTYSDGVNSLREMAEGARSRGYSYLGICDHSQSLSIANGLSPERVAQQQEEIRRLNAAFASDGGPPFRILSGIESDILVDGSLDYADNVLETFDLIVASVHSRFNMTESEATERIITAVANPFTTILGHATGRLLLARDGYPIDHAAVIEACAEHGVVIELNANPRRLDMDWRFVRQATEAGVMISINPDAHSTSELDNTRWGVAVARKGWLTSDQCLNALSLADFRTWLAARQPASSHA